jgi:hypothetical protein
LLKTSINKKFIITFLVLVFFSPTLIKAAHLLYNKHQHEFVLNSKTVEIHESHSDCPICEFQVTQLIANENYYETLRQVLVSEFTPFCSNSILKSTALFSFNLRAPPHSS